MDRKYSMLPSFEIYLSILTDDLMPWLNKNRRQKKFESIIRTAGTAFHGDYNTFFSTVGSSFKMLHVDVSKKIIGELEFLSTLSVTPPGKHMLQAFANQPVKNYREHYYNVITGMSLGAYHDWLEQLLKQCEGPETRSFYLEKILDDIHSILMIPLPEVFENLEDELIVIRVKLALAILYRLLQKKQGRIENSMLLNFDARGWLRNTLQQMDSDHFKEELLKVFDRFTGEKKSSDNEKLSVTPEFEPDHKKMEAAESYSGILNEFMAFQQEFNEVKQSFIAIAQNKTDGSTTEKPGNRWLTSQEVCDLLRISKSTLQRWRKGKKIKFFKMAGKYRYQEQDIQKLMNANYSDI